MSRWPDLMTRFWSKVEKVRSPNGCWLWTGAPAKNGYGLITIEGARLSVHRAAYELLVGPIPPGLTIDHIATNGCTSRMCVKALPDEYGPTHLEAVTMRENLLRGDNWAGLHARATHCPNGHPYDEENTRIYRGSRYCRACRRRPWRKPQPAK